MGLFLQKTISETVFWYHNEKNRNTNNTATLYFWYDAQGSEGTENPLASLEQAQSSEAVLMKCKTNKSHLLTFPFT
jgi:hypothetical protein